MDVQHRPVGLDQGILIAAFPLDALVQIAVVRHAVHRVAVLDGPYMGRQFSRQ